MDKDDIRTVREYWEKHARRDPMWAILSDPAKKGGRWSAADFFETGEREISILMFHLDSLGMGPARGRALDFGCGIGRLTLAMAAYFDRVDGVDVSETMIRLANAFNRFPGRVRYICNPHDRLEGFKDREFDFIYSNIVLQHLRPELTLGYFEEFRRMLRPGGLLGFQLPSHRREGQAAACAVVTLPDDAFAASTRLEGIPESPAAPSTELTLKAYVKNASPRDWPRNDAAPVRLGNHWLSVDGRTMLVQDDGRSSLPAPLPAGEECLVYLTIKTPPAAGDYRCEVDLVQERVSWFRDKGSPAVSFALRVGTDAFERGPVPSADRESPKVIVPLDLPPIPTAEAEDPGDFPMNGIPRDRIVDFFESRGDAILRIEDDEHSGREWVGYRYFIKRSL